MMLRLAFTRVNTASKSVSATFNPHGLKGLTVGLSFPKMYLPDLSHKVVEKYRESTFKTVRHNSKISSDTQSFN